MKLNKFIKKLIFDKTFYQWTIRVLSYANAAYGRVHGNGSSDVELWSLRYLNNDFFSEKEQKEFYKDYSEFVPKPDMETMLKNIVLDYSTEQIEQMVDVLQAKLKIDKIKGKK